MYWLFRIFKRIKATLICIRLALQLLLICMLLFCVVVFVDRQQSGHRSWQLFEVRQGRFRRTSTFFRSISAIDSGILYLLFSYSQSAVVGFVKSLNRKDRPINSLQRQALGQTPYQPIKTRCCGIRPFESWILSFTGRTHNYHEDNRFTWKYTS